LETVQLGVLLRSLNEQVFQLGGIETDHCFFVDGVQLGAESFFESPQIRNSGVETVFAHFQVVPENVVFELRKRVSAVRQEITAIFCDHDPERFERRDSNGTQFILFVRLGGFLLFLKISVGEEFCADLVLTVFFQYEKIAPIFEFHQRFFILNY
jgi:hypothetical protein